MTFKKVRRNFERINSKEMSRKEREGERMRGKKNYWVSPQLIENGPLDKDLWLSLIKRKTK